MLKLISGYSEKDRIIFSTRKSTMTAIRREDGTIGIEFGQKRTPLKRRNYFWNNFLYHSISKGIYSKSFNKKWNDWKHILPYINILIYNVSNF